MDEILFDIGLLAEAESGEGAPPKGAPTRRGRAAPGAAGATGPGRPGGDDLPPDPEEEDPLKAATNEAPHEDEEPPKPGRGPGPAPGSRDEIDGLGLDDLPSDGGEDSQDGEGEDGADGGDPGADDPGADPETGEDGADGGEQADEGAPEGDPGVVAPDPYAALQASVQRERIYSQFEEVESLCRELQASAQVILDRTSPADVKKTASDIISLMKEAERQCGIVRANLPVLGPERAAAVYATVRERVQAAADALKHVIDRDDDFKSGSPGDAT